VRGPAAGRGVRRSASRVAGEGTQAAITDDGTDPDVLFTMGLTLESPRDSGKWYRFTRSRTVQSDYAVGLPPPASLASPAC